jgi:hypothetical protein
MADSVQANSGLVEITGKVCTAQQLIKQDHRQGLAALNELFRAGQAPNPPMDGPYEGKLVAVDIAPGITQVVEWLTTFWMPWKGKCLVKEDSKGDNIFGRKSRPILRVLYPFYPGFVDNDEETFRAFVFMTSIVAGRVDPDRKVLRIDYNTPFNPALTIRRILDEVVQVEEGTYLGKIHFKWWWGRWKMIGYFSLHKKG